MKILSDTPTGLLWNNDGNETIQDAKDADAAKFRVGSRHVPGVCGGGGALSFDKIEDVGEGNRREEVAVIVGGFNGQGGELGICIWNGQEMSDENQPKVVEMRHDEVEFKVPIKAPNFSSAVPVPPSDVVYSSNGRFMLAVQNDGNLVLYDLQVGEPIWSSDTVVE